MWGAFQAHIGGVGLYLPLREPGLEAGQNKTTPVCTPSTEQDGIGLLSQTAATGQQDSGSNRNKE